MFVHIDVMLDAIQFNSVVVGADVTLPNDALILYEDLCLLCMSWPYLQNALCSGMENTSILRDLMTR